jgi:hypothetical protein
VAGWLVQLFLVLGTPLELALAVVLACWALLVPVPLGAPCKGRKGGATSHHNQPTSRCSLAKHKCHWTTTGSRGNNLDTSWGTWKQVFHNC